MLTEDRTDLEFEARYYLSEAKRLQRQGMALIKDSDDMLELAIETWRRAKEVAG